MANTTLTGSNIFGMPLEMYLNIEQTMNLYRSTSAATTFLRVLVLSMNTISFVPNSLIIFLTLRSVSMRTSSNYALLGLSITDILTSFLQIPDLIGQLIAGTLYFGVDECLIQATILYILSLTSQLSVMNLAFERYLYMARGISLTGWQTLGIVCMTWLFIAVLCCVPFFTRQYTFATLKPSSLYCSVRFYDRTPITIYLLVLGLLVTIVTQTLISYFYINVVRAYVASKTGLETNKIGIKDLLQLLNSAKPSEKAKNITESKTNAASVTRVRTELEVKNVKREKEQFEIVLLKKSLMIIIVFVICWSPIFFSLQYEVSTGTELPPWFDAIAMTFANSSAGLNAIMNFYMDSRYRAALKGLFQK